jgi:homospermidine synthase
LGGQSKLPLVVEEEEEEDEESIMLQYMITNSWVRNFSAECLGSWYGLLVEDEEESIMLQYLITK